MDYNYHAHTFRCGHATGTPEEYVLWAIEHGVRYMGFSEHAPFRFPNGFESSYRLPVAEIDDYMAESKRLAEKYKDRVQLRIGFEMEYYPDFFPQMLKTVTDCGGEYLILGQHYPENELSNQPHSTKASDSEQRLRSYVSCVLEGMKSGYFSYVAHPDVLHFTGDPKLYNREMRKICVASRELNIPLEINFLGLREGRHYPNPVFWKIAGEEQAPVTFGCDAHDIRSAFDADSLRKAQEMVEKYGLNYIGIPQICPIQKK
ncbi:MAG: histidinol-phosphatase [Oscillospiraceae bacterium]|nr:histidinol-phosphatase [Oscillospiraceae bacterium]